MLEAELAIGDYMPPHEVRAMKGMEELIQMHPGVSHGQLRHALDHCGPKRDIYDASWLLEDKGMKGFVPPEPTATLEEMPVGDDVTEFDKVIWQRRHHLRKYGEAAVQEEHEI
eukprot:COSAG03_NODE_18800_length_348_cov_0.819277_1_plen_112_part_10